LKILIGSVFSGSGEPSLLKLQLSYLQQTTHNQFDHICYLTENADISKYQQTSTIIGHNHKKYLDPSESHLNGLLSTLKFMRKHDQYDLYLILDSDAFPIYDKWDIKCLDIMLDYDIINCIRAENLDTFSHPCICLFKDPHKVNFKRTNNINLLGQSTSDNQFVFDKCYKHWPLIRSNKVNLHPVISAIYGNLFYHHGCGSRKQIMRTDPYYNKLEMNNNMASDLLSMLLDDPKSYISKLI